MKIFSCWSGASPFPKLFCTHLHAPDRTEKMWIDLAPSICCQYSLITHPALFAFLSCKLHSKPKGQSPPYVGQFPPQPPLGLSLLCTWHIHRSQPLPSSQQVPILFKLADLQLKSPIWIFRLHPSLCHHLFSHPALRSAPSSSSPVGQSL